jgi:hypothetical protein
MACFFSDYHSYRWRRLIHHDANQEQKAPSHGHIEKLKRVYLKSADNGHCINYYVTEDLTSESEKKWRNIYHPFGKTKTICEEMMVLPIFLLNAGHAQCQVIGYFNLIDGDNLAREVRLGVSSLVRTKLPHVYRLIQLLFGANRIIELNCDITYYLHDASFIQANAYISADLEKVDLVEHSGYQEVLIRKSNPSEIFLQPVSCITNLAQKLASNHQGREQGEAKKLFFVKCSDAENMSTPHRAMVIGQHVRSFLADKGYTMLNLESTTLEEFVAAYYNASHIVTSWGNVAVANRFFCNTSCNILILGNQAYENEFKAESRRLNPLHIFPVHRQCIIKYFPDKPSVKNIDDAIQILEKTQ